MPDSPHVSVVIPVYNAERYVEATVRSALASDVRELEILVVDDGSKDRSAAIVRGIEDARVTLLQLPASGGPSRPRNVGIARARAPYVALLDADDLLRPTKLSGALSALEAHPEAGFAFADFEHVDAVGHVLETSVLADKLAACALSTKQVENGWYLIPRSELARGLLYRNFIGTSGVVLRRSVLARVGGFDERLVYCEDLDLWFRLAHHCGALYSARIGHSYRQAPGSLTHVPTLRNARDRITVLRRERRRRSARGERRQLDRQIAETLAAIAYEYRRSRQRFRAAASYAQAAATHPDVRWMRAALTSLVSYSP